MNAFAVGTPASTIAGSSAIGSSIPPRIAGLSAKSTAASSVVDPPELVDAGQDRAMGRGRRARARVVEREERRRPAERRGHGVLEEPVRLLDRSRPGYACGRRCSPGGRAARRRGRPRAAPATSPDRSASTASIDPARTATSARREPVAVTTVPPRISRSGPEPSIGGTAEEYGVRARRRPSAPCRASGRGH